MAIATGTALLAAAGISAVGSAISGAKGRTAARRAGEKQDTAIQNALTLQSEQLAESRADISGAGERSIAGIQPFQEFGTGAIDPLSELLGGGGDIGAFLESTPGFRASLEGGTRAIDASASNAGLLGSGARLKELSRFGSDLATRTLNQERNALFSQLGFGERASGNIANIETGTAANLANRGSAFTTQSSNLLTGRGANQADTILNRNSAFQAGLEGVTDAAGNALGTLSTPGIFGTPSPQAAAGKSAGQIFGQIGKF